MIAAYCLFVTAAALVIGYTMAFQRATLFWGKSLVATNGLSDRLLPRGMQDAITPKAQNMRNLLHPLLLLAVFIGGIILFKWYVGIFGLLATFMLGSVFLGFFPQPNSRFFHTKLIRDLEARRSQLQANGDRIRLEAIDHVIEMLEQLAP